MYLVILSVQPRKALPATTYVCVIGHLHVCHEKLLSILPFMYLVILSVQPRKALPATTYVCVIGHLHVCHSLSQDGWTPFHAACHEGHAQVAELLLQAGASLEMETEVR